MARFVPIIITVKEGNSEQVVRELTNAFKKLDREVENTSRSAAGLSFKSLAGAQALGQIAANAFSRLNSMLFQGGRALLDYSSNLESTRIAFTTMMGSADAANAHLQQLQEFALKTPFQFSELVAASQRMQALGFSAAQVVPILKDVGNAVAAAGGGSERLDRVVLALAQIQSKGRLMTQEMNQLAESGIPAWKMLEVQLGKSRAELMDMTEKGQISAQVFLDAFQKFSRQNFGDLMEKQSKTFQGAMSNIKDALFQTSERAFAPLYQRLSENAQAMGNLATESKKFRDDMKFVGDQIMTVWDGAVEAFYVFRDAAKLVISSLTGQTIALIDLFQALARAIEAGYYELKAWGQLLMGDLQGALTSHEQAQRAIALSYGSVKDAANALGAPVRTLGEIYTEAAKRAEDAAAKTSAAAATMGGSLNLMIGKMKAGGILESTQFGIGIPQLSRSLTGTETSTAGGGGGGAGKGKREFTSDQLRFAKEIVETGLGLGANERQILAALAAAMVESKVANLRHGDRDSLGIFQQRPSQGWGSFNQILDPEFAIKSFFLGQGTNPGIFDVAQSGSIGQMAQRVQRSAFPKRYDQALGSANRLFNEVLGGSLSIKSAVAPADETGLRGMKTAEMLDVFRGERGRAAIETTEPQIIESLGREWDLYYDRVGEREAELADRRKFFAEEYYENQRSLGQDLENLELDLKHFRAQNADDQFVEQRRLLSVKGEELNLLQDIARAQDDLATGPYNESLRIQLALLQDIVDIRRRDENAIIAQNRAQLELKDATIVHGQQVRASVMEHFASQRTMTEGWSDGIISAYDKVMGFLDRGIEKLTRGIPIITQLISALVHQLMNRVFQRFLDAFFPASGGGSGLGTQSSGLPTGGGSGGGIFGSIGNAIKNIFSGGGAGAGVTGTPPFAGDSGFQLGPAGGLPIAATPWNLIPAMGGGITAPTSLSSQVTNQSSIAAVIQQAARQKESLLSQFGLQSPTGGLSGGGAALAVSAHYGIFDALFGDNARAALGRFGALSPLVSSPFTVGFPLFALFQILGRSAQRRADETKREALSQDTITALNQLLGQARSMDLAQATAAFEQIRVNYFNGVNQMKDSKTKRIATDWWYKPEHPPQVTWAKVKDAVAAGERAREIEKHLIPEFAHGTNFVPRGGLFSMVTGLTPVRLTPGEAVFAPGSPFGEIVPGQYRGYDSVLTAVPPGSKVVPRHKVASFPGRQSGGDVGVSVGGGGATVVIEELNVHTQLRVGKNDASEIVVTGVETRNGGNAVVKRVNTFLSEGN